MTRATVLPLLLLWTSLHGCVTRSSLPVLSLHALLSLHQREHLPDHERQRASELALLVQLSFLTEPHGLRKSLEENLNMLRVPADVEPCAQAALCEWQTMAEESALLALGVAP